MKLQNRKETLLFIFIFLFGVFLLRTIPPEYMCQWDSLGKLHQAESLIENRFKSESLKYPAIDIDPERRFFPIPNHFFINGNWIGHYPIFFTGITAILLKLISSAYIQYLYLFILLLLIYFLYKKWQLTPLSIFLFYFCTPFLFLWLELSENLFMLTSYLIGLTYYFKGQKKLHFIASGFFMGLAVHMRLEGIYFTFFLLSSSILFFSIKDKKIFQKVIFSGLGFSLAVLIFISYNYYLYKNPLGARFLELESDFFPGFSERIRRAFVLMFFGDLKLGIFGYSPFILLATYLFIKNFQLLNMEIKHLGITSLLFIFAISFTSPNDGVTNWGSRYLYIALFPMIIILQNTRDFIKSRFLQFVFVLSILFSLFAGKIGIDYFKGITKVQKKHQKMYKAITSDILLFHKDGMPHYNGIHFLTRKMLLIKENRKIELLIELLRKNASGKTLTFFEVNYDKELQHLKKINPEAYKAAVKLHSFNRAGLIKKLNKNFRLLKQNKINKNIITHKYKL